MTSATHTPRDDGRSLSPRVGSRMLRTLVAGRWALAAGDRRARRDARRALADEFSEAELLPPAQSDPRD